MCNFWANTAPSSEQEYISRYSISDVLLGCILSPNKVVSFFFFRFLLFQKTLMKVKEINERDSVKRLFGILQMHDVHLCHEDYSLNLLFKNKM